MSNVKRLEIHSSVEDLLRSGKNLARRGTAILGKGEFHNASLLDRARGVLGFHDETHAFRRRHTACPRKADVIGVSRGWYDHYGIYIGKKQVIHYSSETSDIGDNKVVQSSLDEFLRGEVKFFVLEFLVVTLEPDESIARACSMLGNDAYDLFRNNCEHFVHWCKTGQSESSQTTHLKFLLNKCMGS